MSIEIPVGETLVVLRWTLAGDNEEMVTTFGVHDLSTNDPAVTAEDVYTQATDASSITPAVNLLTNWTFNGVSCYLQDDLGQVVGHANHPISGGTGATSSLPQNCCTLIKKLTASAGRRNQGRFYCPPFNLGEADVTQSGAILSARAAVIQGDWDAFYDRLVTSELAPVLFHSTGPSTPITSFSLDPVIATQRRRLR